MAHHMAASVSRLLSRLCAIAVCALATATAQGAEKGTAVASVLPGVEAFDALPDDFDPATASARRIALEGLPPRPDREADPAGYAAWLIDVSPDIRRSVPELSPAPARPQRRTTRTSSINWSGIIFQREIAKYGRKSFQSVHATWSVPSVQPPLGTCEQTPDSGPYLVGIWPGLGGFDGDAGLLQAGTAAMTACDGGAVTAQHFAWYEFYPNPPVTIDSIPVLPGQVLSVYVWSTSPLVGHSHVVNRTLRQSASFKFKLDAGDTRLIGSSAEWIVERPGGSDGPSNLANYTEVVIYEASATTGDGLTVEVGGSYGNHAISKNLATMRVDGATGKKLSIAEVIGERAIQFRARGPAMKAP